MVPAGFKLLFLLQNTCIALCILWNWWLAHSSQKCFPQDMCCIYELESAVASNPCPILAFTSPRLVGSMLAAHHPLHHSWLWGSDEARSWHRDDFHVRTCTRSGFVPFPELCRMSVCQICQLFIYTPILRGECSNSFICFLSSKNSIVWFFFNN